METQPAAIGPSRPNPTEQPLGRRRAFPHPCLSAIRLPRIEGVDDLLVEIADALRGDLYWATDLVDWWVLSIREVLVTALLDGPLSPKEAFVVVLSQLHHQAETGDKKKSTVIKAGRLLAQFADYVERRYGFGDIQQVGAIEVCAWLESSTRAPARDEPAARTKENRRWAVDLFFRTLRSLDLYSGDPLMDFVPYDRPPGELRPLTDAEMARCRLYAPKNLRDSVRPSVLALAEATGNTFEIPRVVVEDIDLGRKSVWLNGSPRVNPRWGTLTEWGLVHLQKRIADIGVRAASSSVTYTGRGSADSMVSTTGIALGKVYRRAGLGDDAQIGPESVRAWVGQRLYLETHDIEEVAHRLGIRSLDDSRQFIDLPFGRCDVPPQHRTRT